MARFVAYVMVKREDAPPLQLYWSKQGDVLCHNHVPARDSARFTAEGWLPISQRPGQRLKYQCQRCHPRRLTPRQVNGSE
jgi:hypothetical protein